MRNVLDRLRTVLALRCDRCGGGGQTVSWYVVEEGRRSLCADCAASLAHDHVVRPAVYPLPPPG